MKHLSSLKRTLTVFALALGLGLLLAQPALAQSEEAEEAMARDLLDTIHQFRLTNFIALNTYYNYTVDPDESLVRQINQSIGSSREMLGEIGNLAGESLSGSELEDLQVAFQDFENQMDINVEDVRQAGYPDLRLLSDMANQAHVLSVQSERIYDQVAGQDETPTASDVELAREASILMALMVTRYSARSSSTVAQIFQGADTDESLDELAMRFDDIISELRSRNTSEEIDDLMSEVSVKWDFIKSSYIQYDERNVSFVINRYSTSILENLERAVDRLKTAA